MKRTARRKWWRFETRLVSPSGRAWGMAARFDGSSVFLASFLEALKMMAESWAYLFSNWNTAAGKSARKRIELKNGGSA